MADKLTPPPDVGDPRFGGWLFKLWRYVSSLQAGGASVSSNLSDADALDLTDGGDSSLHYHSSDRNRANHTGTQLADTISDFDSRVSSLVTTASASGSTDIIATQVFGG